jgi:hypothetical protein
MRIFIAILSILNCLDVASQPIPTFNRTYIDSSNWSASGVNAIELNGEFIIASRGQGLTLNSNYTMLTKTDQNGVSTNRLFTHRTYEEECWGGIGVESANNNDVYIYVGERLLSNSSKFNINITKYTTDFDTVWNLKNADSSSIDLPLSSKVINNLIYVAGLRGIENSNPQAENGILLVADTSGNQVNFNQYNLENTSHRLFSIAKGEANNVLLGGGRSDSLYYGLVLKTDSLGNMIWHRWYPELWGVNISEYFDSTYLLTSWTPNGIGSIITKIDSNGDVIWQRTYFYGTGLTLYKSIKTFDGGIVSVGLANVATQNFDDAYIQKVDAQGNLIWQNSFNGIGSRVDFFENVIETNDGGLLINGSTNEGTAGGQNLWLVKLDSMGCLDPDCWVGVEQADANTLGVAVYPNPATDWLYLKYDNTSKINLEIFNLSGQLVLQHQHTAPKEGIEISHLSAGLYLLRFVDEFGNMATEKLVVE